jgi:hypothetical protein
VRQFSSSFLRALIAAVLVVFGGTVLCAQEIRIRVVDGRNGHPIGDERVNVLFDAERSARLVPTDRSGVATVNLGTDDVETIRITSDYYMPCQPHPKDSPFVSYSIKEVLQSGIASSNLCGKIEGSPKPGELIFFVRPRSFLERLRQ